ncbi:cytochrome C553 [Photobacterium aquae]|uniref:Cytochrome C553 n=1 Tax=Photobacterium aquae TaxID=1195763 RepID=A0A0J1H5P7_9GAMM|nr:c-type cytochrome [Photobacterium aquae]KLV07021.1 cytochrome C553 [Photobacterium aquae]
MVPLVAVFVCGGAISPFATADDQFEIGKEKAKVCMTCHGENGISSIESYPNLRGQKMTYLITSLKSYQSRERSGGLAVLMHQQADALSEQDMEDISYYYSTLGSDNSN